MNIRYLLLLFSAASILSSCMVSHQIFYERAFEYDGISVTEPTTCYHHGGKLYVKGQRSAMRFTRSSPWYSLKEAIIGPSHRMLTPIEGSEYGPMLYHEVDYYSDNFPQLFLSSGGSWQELHLPQARKQQVQVGVSECHPNTESRHMTRHAIYALPTAAVAAVAVDLPLTLGYYALMPVAATGSLLFNSQQQQLQPPDQAPTTH
ncbi:MAG: hypothetical protein IJ943_04990 [Akkermansia sp.]|nr:hypothetical protein [Akkermansia sp.]